MTTLMKMLMSRTVWTIVLMFLVGGIQAVTDLIPLWLLPYVQGVLGLIAIYFKMNPSQKYGA